MHTILAGNQIADHKEVDIYQHLYYGPFRDDLESQKEPVMPIAADRQIRKTAREPATLVAGAGLIAVMAVGSVLMWIGVPLGLLWLASHLQSGTEPSMGPYLVVVFGLPALMILLGKALASLDRAFSRVSGYNAENRRVHLPWHKSMRGERGSSHRRTVLDVVMIANVMIAGGALLFWFLFLAGSSVPR
jgi:hypothetical protein